MIKKRYILLGLVFITAFQMQTHNQCGNDASISAVRKTAVISSINKDNPVYSFSTFRPVFLDIPATKKISIDKMDKRPKQINRKTDDPILIGLILGASDLLRKDIDLKFATFRPDKLKLNIPLCESINLWWAGCIPGAYRSENSFGLTYSSTMTFYPSDQFIKSHIGKDKSQNNNQL